MAVHPIVENPVGIFVHVVGVFFVRDDESRNGEFVIAVRASDIGAVLICFGTCHTCNRSGLEQAEFFVTHGT